MNFEEAIRIIIKHECGEGDGYVNDPKDPGGETKYGISKRAHPNVDIKNLTLEKAILIYKAEYWDLCMADMLPSDIRLHVVDFAVHSGVSTAIKKLQEILDIKVDGIQGQNTIRSCYDNLLRENPINIPMKISAKRLLLMRSLPNFMHCAKGWVERVAENMLLS